MNKGHGMYCPVWDGVYKRCLAANKKEYIKKWWQPVSYLNKIILVVLNHIFVILL